MKRALLFVALVVALASATACVISSGESTGRYRNVRVESATPDQNYIEEDPPAPRVEVIPAQPASHYVWISGVWTRRGGHWVWVSGQWCEPPRGHQRYHGGCWERRGRGYVWVQGEWR